MNIISVKPLVIAAACGLLLGCATTQQSDLDEIRTIAEKAAADAAAAQSRADQAMSTASDAKAQSDATEAKVDRMFKKAMYK